MHHIYHTEAVILGSRSRGEAGKYYFLFTRDLGLIYASAAGIRKASSRLRYVLQDYAYVKVDLVRGRDFWRITSASKTNQLDSIRTNLPAFQVMVKICGLLYKLLRGEDANESLFDDFLEGLFVLEKKNGKRDIANVEVVMALRILNNLGYVGEHALLDDLVKSPLDEDLVFGMADKRMHAIRAINRALRETHL